MFISFAGGELGRTKFYFIIKYEQQGCQFYILTIPK